MGSEGDYPHQATHPSAFMIATILFPETIIIPNIDAGVNTISNTCMDPASRAWGVDKRLDGACALFSVFNLRSF